MRILVILILTSIVAAVGAREKQATPAKDIRAPQGFQVELLRSAREGEDSWISMSFDDAGRIVLGLDSVGVARLTIHESGTVDFERIDTQLKHCRGVLFSHGAVYVNATNSKEFWRLRDADSDGRFEERTLLKKFVYDSRYGHGQNQLRLGPDGMIYLVNGNDNSFPEGMSSSSPYQNPRKDWLLPKPEDEGQDDRVGCILRTDRDGKTWEVLAGGFRNQVDMAFNADGEMFTWDADMEWDVGLPWYRPTRLNHIASGGEYGWRWGTGKWPAFRADSLPSTLDTGLGSPTGLEFGTRSRFSGKYRHALYMGEWQNGRIVAVQLTPNGASYSAEMESFVEGGPMNVCDLTFGPDGAMYFITGGRGSQSGLYRVRQIEKLAEPNESVADTTAEHAHRIRHELERFHGKRNPRASDVAWPHLRSDDPWIRNAARVAIEHQELKTWRDRALKESHPMAAAQAIMALVRAGDTNQNAVLQSLARISLSGSNEPTLLALLRAYALSFIRQGRPSHTTELAGTFATLYPHRSRAVNHELLELLVYLRAPETLDGALRQLEKAPTQEEQIFIAHTISKWPGPWTMEQHRDLLRWLGKARAYRGGHLFSKTIQQIETATVDRLNAGQRVELAPLIAVLKEKPAVGATVTGKFVREWTLSDFEDLAFRDRSIERGQQAAAKAMCLMCHRVGDQGGLIGPDLSTVGRRFDARMLLESIIEPDKALDPKYRNTTYELTEDRSFSGRVAGVGGDTITLEVNPFTQETVQFKRADIQSTRVSNVSPMPAGLINHLTREEILDLLAWLRNAGQPAN